MSCPNINLEEWKLLVASRGEDVAYALWDLYDGNVPEREQQAILLQLEGIPASKISSETLAKVKQVAAKMGVDIQSLSTYLKGNPDLESTGVNAVADLTKKVIAVATGKEDVALTEEIVHVATAIIEQTNPRLITALISKIDRFKIYKQVLDTYGKRKDYQLPNGKPDIRKIKKEAVDKLIAEVLINQSEGSTEFPELMQEESRSMIQEWWDAIIDFIKGLYTKTNISLFEEAAATILSGELGATADVIEEGGVFLQVENPIRDQIYDKVIAEDAKLVIIPATTDKPRHYQYEGEDVAKTVTQLLGEGKNIPEDDGQKKLFGTEGHNYIEKEITTNLIDDKGFAKKVFTDQPIDTKLQPKIANIIKTYVRELIASYPEGTRFLIEKKVINKQVKGGLASTVDFKAIIPIVKEDGTPDVKIDTLDWKFLSIDKTRTEDIPWFKRKDYIAQMIEYVKIDRTYGVKPEQTRKSRMIPFIVNYDYVIPGDKKSGLVATSIEVGKLDSTKETNLYMLPVAIPTETTGNKEIDRLLVSLRQEWDKLYSKRVAFEDKEAKNLQLEQISHAIRRLHMQLDFKPLFSIGQTFLKSAQEALKDFENLDLSTLSKEELDNRLGEILTFQEGAKKYTNLDKLFISHLDREQMTPEESSLLLKLERLSRSTERMIEESLIAQRAFALQLAEKSGFSEDILQPEVAIDWFSKTFLEASKLSSSIINLASNLWMRAKSLTDLSVSEKINDFEKVLIPASKEASAKGKSVFDLIGVTKNGKPTLIKKVAREFLNEVVEAKEKKDKQFFLSNLDIEEYDRQAAELIRKGVAELESVTFSSNEEEDDKIKFYRITKLKDSLDIHRPTFNGYNDYKFGQLVKKTLKIEDHLSEDYKNMAKSKAALDLWNFVTNLNQEAYKYGFISKQGMSFVPLVEATIIEKLSQGKNKATQLKDIFSDLYTARIDEQQAFSAIDKETGEVRREIPKYFTRTDKSEDQLSKDITKIIPLYIKALEEYKNARGMENTLLTLHKVEESKGSIRVNAEGDIIFEGEEASVDKDLNKNAELYKVIVDDYLYNLSEDLGGVGNVNLSRVLSKVSGTEEQAEARVVSIKKGIKSADVLTRSLAVGLKPLIGLANAFGVGFNVFINKGGVYNMDEFIKNLGKISTGVSLSTTNKALLDLFIPLNEDVTAEKVRDISKKESYLSWLGRWTFSDVMMSTNSFPERKLQYASALSFLENTMVVEGKLVNIRQYLKKQDRKVKYQMPVSERAALEKSFEKRVEDLKNSSSLEKIAKTDDNGVTIPGVSKEEIADYRVSIREYNRTLNAQLSIDNKAGFRRDTILSSFMMFKTWIPKLLYARIGDIKMNKELDQWEYGRARAFFKTWATLGLTNIKGLRDVYLGNEEGLKIMDEILEAKKLEYYKKTGKTLEITKEEFYDLMRTQITNQLKELGLLFSLMGLLIAAKAAEPPEDATDLEKNRYKYWAKALNKISDEISFYYNPTSADAITRGSIIPSLGLLVKAEKTIESFGKEVTGFAIGDQDLIDKSYPAKYFLNMIPGAAQFQTEILPLIDPELAKAMGIRVTSESRQR